MANFEPKIANFFALIASDDVPGEMAVRPENIRLVLYYTNEEQQAAVLRAFADEKSKEKRNNIFRGLVEILPLSQNLVEAVLAEDIKDIQVMEAYQRIFHINSILSRKIKQLNQHVVRNNALNNYTQTAENNQKRIDELSQNLVQEKIYNKKFDEQREGIKFLEDQIQQLKQEQESGYWEKTAQELEETKMKLEAAKREFVKDCRELKELQKQLEEYQSNTVSKDVSRYLSELRKLASKLPDDEVN